MRLGEATRASGGAIYTAGDGFGVLVQISHTIDGRRGEPFGELVILGLSPTETAQIIALLGIPSSGWEELTRPGLAAFFGMQPTKNDDQQQGETDDSGGPAALPPG
jgi:hypothetical protein